MDVVELVYIGLTLAGLLGNEAQTVGAVDA